MATAYHWQEPLESDQYASVEELAAANDVDRSYADRILRLTSLPPEIVEAILDGNEPKGLTLAKLHKRLPLIWSEQRWNSSIWRRPRRRETGIKTRRREYGKY